jgi:hypothetical protein
MRGKAFAIRKPGLGAQWVWISVLMLAVLAGPLCGDEVKAKRLIETEVVRLTPAGFEPARIERPRGTFRLFVQSLLALPACTLVLENESKAAIKSSGLARAPRQRWVEDHSLTPGTYVLRVQEQPKLTLQIVVR